MSARYPEICGVKMFSRVMFAATVASILVLAFTLWRELDNDVTKIVINGDLTPSERTSIREVLVNGEWADIGGVLSFNLAAVASRVQTLPWARDVSVRRSWPDALVVTLHRAQPVARWGSDEYVSVGGRLHTLPDTYAGLPRFDVALAAPEQSMEVYRLLDQLAAPQELRIAELRQNLLGEWILLLTADGAQFSVRLGNEQLSQRMRRFVSAYRKFFRDDARQLQYVDARYATGLAVRFVEDPGSALLAANAVTSSQSGDDG